jgi:hypothetical protein
VTSHPCAAIVFLTARHLYAARKESVIIIAVDLGQADQLLSKAWSFFLDEGLLVWFLQNIIKIKHLTLHTHFDYDDPQNRTRDHNVTLIRRKILVTV